MPSLRLLFGLALPTAALLSSFGCSPSSGKESSGGNNFGASGGSVSAGGTPGSGGAGIPTTGGVGSGGLMVTGGASGMGAGGTGAVQECVGDKSTGEPVPLDVYVMLDISGSMLDASGTGTKWDAVKSALDLFFNDTGSAGLSVAIQYFPLRLPGVPTSCTTDAECGAGAPCLLNVCSQTPGALIGCDPAVATFCDDPILRDDGPCDADMTCHLSGAPCTDATSCQTRAGKVGTCGQLGVCEDDATYSCPAVGGPAMAGCGMCLAATSSFCVHENICDPASYQTPAVEFGALPGAAASLSSSIATQVPLGDTPTRPALRGAISHARDWAAANVGHSVVVVLATDGFPTECTGGTSAFGASATALTDVVNVATEGLAGASRIQTFVIGVFSSDEATAQANLDQIAVAGGTEHAYVIDTSGNVQQGFLDALNEIRAARLDCEFQIPQPPSGKTLNFNEVNFQYTDANLMSTSYYYVAPDGCTGAPNEWHYNVAPAPGSTPTRIIACPATCDALKTVIGGTVQIQLGCTTVVR